MRKKLVVEQCLFSMISIVLFLSLIYVEFVGIESQYEAYANVGFMNDQKIYEYTNSELSEFFDSVEEIIAAHENETDTFTILARTGWNSFAVYDRGGGWSIPLRSGQMFDEEVYESSTRYALSKKEDGALGVPYTDFEFINLKSFDYQKDGVMEGIANCQLLTNVDLHHGAYVNGEFETKTITNDVLFEQKLQFYYLSGAFLLLSIVYYLKNQKELMVMKFLGNSIEKVTLRLMVSYWLLTSVCFVVSCCVFYQLEIGKLCFDFLFDAWLDTLFGLYLFVLRYTILLGLLNYVVHRYVPIAKLGWNRYGT